MRVEARLRIGTEKWQCARQPIKGKTFPIGFRGVAKNEGGEKSGNQIDFDKRTREFPSEGNTRKKKESPVLAVEKRQGGKGSPEKRRSKKAPNKKRGS